MAQHKQFIERTAFDFDIDEVSSVLHKQLLDTIEEQRIKVGKLTCDVADQELLDPSVVNGADKVRLEELLASIKNRVNNRQWNQKAYHKFLKFFKKRSVRDFVDLALVPASAFGGGVITGAAVTGISGMSAPTDCSSDAAKKAWDLANQAGSFAIDLVMYSESEAGGNLEDWVSDKSPYPSMKKRLRGNSINAVMKELIEDGETHIKRSARQLASAAESFGILREWEHLVKHSHEDGDDFVRQPKLPDEDGADPWKFLNCDEAVTLGSLSCNFLHHYDKLRVHSWEVFKYVNFLSSRIAEWNAVWDEMRDISCVGTRIASDDHSTCGSLCYMASADQPAVAKAPLANWTVWETDLGISRSRVKGQEKATVAELEADQTAKIGSRDEKILELQTGMANKELAGERLEQFDKEKSFLKSRVADLTVRLRFHLEMPEPSGDEALDMHTRKLNYVSGLLETRLDQIEEYGEEQRKKITDEISELEERIPVLRTELETLEQELGRIAATLDLGPVSKQAKAVAGTEAAKSGAPKPKSARFKRFKNWFSLTGIQDQSQPASALRVVGEKGDTRVSKDMLKGKDGIKFKGTRLDEDAASETPGRLHRLLTLLNDIWWPIEHKSRGHRMKRKWGRWSMYREHVGRKALRFSIMALGATAGVVIIVSTGGAAAPVIAMGIGATLWSADKLSGDKLDRRFAKKSQEKLEDALKPEGDEAAEIDATIKMAAHQGAKATLKRGAAVRRQFASCEKNFQRMLYFSHERKNPRNDKETLAPYQFADCEDAASYLWAAAKFRRHYEKLVEYITPLTLYTGTLLQAMQAMEAYWWGADGYKDATTDNESLDSFDGATAADPPENMRAVVMGAIKKVVFEDKAWHDAHCGTTPKDRSDRTFRVRRRGRNHIKKPYSSQRSAICYGPVQSNAEDDSGIPFKHKHKIRRRLNLAHKFVPNTTNFRTSGSGNVPHLLERAWGGGWTSYLRFVRQAEAEATGAPVEEPVDGSALDDAIAAAPQVEEAPMGEDEDPVASASGAEDPPEVEGDGDHAEQLASMADAGEPAPDPEELEPDAGLAVLAAITLCDPDQALLAPDHAADPGGGDVTLDPED